MLHKLEFKREAAYVDGTWIGADSGKTVAVTDPATGETLGTVPDCGQGRDRARHRRRRHGVAGLARQDGQGAGQASCTSSPTSSRPTTRRSAPC